MKSKIALAAVAAGIAAAGLLYASPYLTLRSIAKAVENKDADAVSEHVDFPALRESVKGYMLVKMEAQLNTPSMKDNPFAGFGQVLAMGLVDRMTETLVSPAGVMLMLKNGQVGRPRDATAAGADTTGRTELRKDFTVVYQGWSKVYVHPKNEDGGFIFKRDGLMSWKLVAVKMPSNP
ncbi:DUF2939 domain-containing protein [Comamonas humi]